MLRSVLGRILCWDVYGCQRADHDSTHIAQIEGSRKEHHCEGVGHCESLPAVKQRRHDFVEKFL